MDKPKTTPKDFFTYLSVFAMLYVSTISLISLLFEIINALFPDQITNGYYYDYYSGGMRLAIASLIIIFPVYLIVASYIHRYLTTYPDRRDVAVRKWLTYLTLFLTGAVVVIDLVVLVNTFLGGEVTSRFVWKVLAVLFVSGSVYAYYFYDLKKTFSENNPKRSRIIIAIASLVVIASLVGGFVIMGSPMKMRDLRFDDQRLSDLQSIQWQLINYWQQKGSLPSDLALIEDAISGFYLPIDPETGAVYTYEKTGKLSFKLCGTFTLPSRTDVRGRGLESPMMVSGPDEGWRHDAGVTCFDRTIDPDLYPVRPKF